MIVEYETAKLAKEQNFDLIESSDYFYDGFTGKLDFTKNGYQENVTGNYRVAAPTQELLRKWLRDKDILIEIHLDRTSAPKYAFSVYKYTYFGNYENIIIDPKEWCLYRLYEEALEEALLTALKSIES
jgi:hypothetical protein